MITRIVKMTFLPDKVDLFLDVFKEINNRISSFEGCLYLELVQDVNNKNTFFTISRWSEESYLEKYRQSEFFKKTWLKTKVLFGEKPYAWSTASLFKYGSDQNG